MTNAEGMPIWYELMSADPDASRAFYEDVIGWAVEAQPSGDMDYRMIDTGTTGLVGGLARYTEGQTPGGMTPGWRFYVGVDDVDATVAKLTAAGGSVILPAFDLPGVGRMAYVADPQGIAFYVMRGASPDSSTAWDPMAMGKCSWNELVTPDIAAAKAFYADVLGWTYPDSMPMGEMGDYWFVEAAGQTIGGAMQQGAQGQPAGWTFYFRAPDIGVAADRVTAGGGSIHAGPMEVPGGDQIIVATDPAGTVFGVVAPGVSGETA
ncbi:VOC family protein [Sphingomonas donggukensis]|uniref:VOC family protein n=1 Tax=Sphingomonas donggukensis TaxID=2949093 RepID=A0ABY4TRW3_9SPHN|nr:VOC family protein [Sphingomonas donggukensis]URW75134.1 VOC family protein [Sphingomonas donggukensis]